jgi:hypothetical protein
LSRVGRAWRVLDRERRIAALAAVALLVTMFLPWYGLQSLNRKSGAIYSHTINAFGDVSFVEAAIFVVAVGVSAIVLARADGREFHLPGGDGVIVTIAGAWAGLLIFYRVFDRPDGGGYPVGIEWGFFLAFVAAGSLAFAGWRMRASERPEPPLRARPARAPRRPTPPPADADLTPLPADADLTPAPADADLTPLQADADITVRSSLPARRRRSGSESIAARERSRYPPAPPEQLSFEDPPTRAE